MEDKYETEKTPSKTVRYNSLDELLKDTPNLTVNNPIVLFFLFLVWSIFVWYYVTSFSTQNLSDHVGMIVILIIFSYSLFLSFKAKFKK